MSVYTRLYLINSSIGEFEQFAPCGYKAIEEFKKNNPEAKKIKVIAVMTGYGWKYKGENK